MCDCYIYLLIWLEHHGNRLYGILGLLSKSRTGYTLDWTLEYWSTCGANHFCVLPCKGAEANCLKITLPFVNINEYTAEGVILTTLSLEVDNEIWDF